MATSELKTGPIVSGDGSQAILRGERLGSLVVADGMARYGELVSRGLVFTANLYGTATPTAGQIHTAGAPPAAAAVTQFAVFNPVGSGKLLTLLRVAIATVSGTPTAGSVLHGIFNTGALPSAIAQTNGTVRNNLINGPGSVCAATTQMVAAGAALTGGAAPVVHSLSSLSLAGFAPTVFGNQSSVEELAGLIVIPPGMGYVPLMAGVGTTHLVSYSATWAETPI